MNTAELAQRLHDEGCNPTSYAIGSRGAAWDAYCLTRSGGQWRAFYTERGKDSPPIFTSASEAEASELFLRHILSLRHDHCVGFFKSAQSAEALQERLRGLGVASWTDRIPYSSTHDLRYRVFVTGKAVFPARAALGSIPVRDEGA